jgi:tetratricopeptide (TPR) repeat protein/tRNA A-37 threonylcarbamoyl transferase component Bud32
VKNFYCQRKTVVNGKSSLIAGFGIAKPVICSIIFIYLEVWISLRRRIVYLTIILLISLTVHGEETFKEKVAKLEKRLQEVSVKEKIETLNLLALYFYKRQPNRAITYGRQALKLAEKINHDKGKAHALVYLANATRAVGHTKDPFKYGREALRIFRNLGDQPGTVNALNTLGYLYRSIDNYDEALKYLIEALEICDKMGYPKKKEGIYYQLGSLYIRLGDPEKAMGYFQRAFKSAERAGDRRRMASYLNNIGLAYRNLGQYHRALDCFKRYFNLSTELEDPYGISAAAGNIGFTYGQLNNFAKALEYLDKAVETAEENDNMKGVCDNLTHIGYQYFKRKDYTRAGTYYEKALKIARDIKDNTSIKKIYEHFSNLYIAQKDYKRAMEYYMKLIAVKDQMIDEKKNQQLLELQERYEAEKRAREIETLRRKNKVKTITRNAFIAGFALVLAILIFIFKKYLYFFSFWKKQKYIGQYRLIKILGTGGMSTVFKAHSIRDKNRIAAIKVLKDELSRRESNRKRFKQEGTIVDKLNHANIIKIFERGEYDEKLFIVMEYVEGRTLAEKIETGGIIPLYDCLHIMRQITAALTFIHRANIIHRDLKPENIMITEKDGDKNVVKLLDFGLSKMKFQSRITMSGMLVGTASYMAPEQITELESSPASDVFNLGLIFYEMLTGRVAFPGDSLSGIEKQILYTTPAAPGVLRPGIPGGLNDLIMQMLSKNPDHRPSVETVLTRLIT